MFMVLDVSRWQGRIDWDTVKASGRVHGVMLRALGSRSGTPYIDPMFETNYSACIRLGIPVGVYYYSCAVTAPQRDAELALLHDALRGKRLQLPAAIDVEDARLRALTPDALSALVAGAARQLEHWGLYAMVYTYTHFADTALHMDTLAPFDLWLADYRGKRPARRHGMWQYTSRGRVSGISGDVDVNVAYFAPGAFSGSKAYTRPMVRQGDRGDAVKQLQTLLSFCGWTLAMDGIWGVKTDSAVKGYQYKAGLTVDGIVGPKTWAKLFRDAIVARAKEIAEYMVKHKWRYKGGGYVAKSTYAATKKLDKPGCSCAHFVSWVLQDVGLLKPGKVLSHSKAGYGTGAKSIVNADQLIGCTVTYPNERIADYKGKLKPGDVLVHDSSIGIYDPIGGTPAILTAREGQPINGKRQYTDLLVSSGYEWKRDVLAVVGAKI